MHPQVWWSGSECEFSIWEELVLVHKYYVASQFEEAPAEAAWNQPGREWSNAKGAFFGQQPKVVRISI